MNTATAATYGESEDSWQITGGVDVDGDALTVVLANDPAQVRVKTVY